MPMQMNFSMMSDTELHDTVIKVVGVGGGGGNAVNRMITSGMKGVDFIAMNTDFQVLSTSLAQNKLNIGSRLTRGMGAGGDPVVGQRAAEESRDEISALLKGANMLFITAGMGGGTGTGAAPVVAEIARSMNILTVAVVTKPFAFERAKRMKNAEMGIAALKENVDAIIVVPNERLRFITEEKLTFANAFAMADSVLCQGVQSISDIIGTNGFINLDFADVESIMRRAGNAHMGVGRARGKDKAEMAAKAAINSPLLETSISGAMGVIVSISAPPDTLLEDIYTTSDLIAQETHSDANLIWGLSYDENLEDEIVVTVIATGFEPADQGEVKKYISDIVNYRPKDGSGDANVAKAAVNAAVSMAAPAAPAAAAPAPVAAPVPVAAPAPAAAQPAAPAAPAATETQPTEAASPFSRQAPVEAPVIEEPVEDDPFEAVLGLLRGRKNKNYR